MFLKKIFENVLQIKNKHKNNRRSLFILNTDSSKTWMAHGAISEKPLNNRHTNFQGDHTCIVNECNSVKEHCVCPSWYGQTKIKIEKDCECEMGYAPDGIGGCQKICYREGYQLGDVMGTKHCNSKCIGELIK